MINTHRATELSSVKTVQAEKERKKIVVIARKGEKLQQLDVEDLHTGVMVNDSLNKFICVNIRSFRLECRC